LATQVARADGLPSCFHSLNLASVRDNDTELQIRSAIISAESTRGNGTFIVLCAGAASKIGVSIGITGNANGSVNPGPSAAGRDCAERDVTSPNDVNRFVPYQQTALIHQIPPLNQLITLNFNRIQMFLFVT
jgi:hypothetical protein